MNLKRDIALIREGAKQFLIDECTIQKKTTQVIKGEVTETWGNDIVTACRFITRANTTITRSQQSATTIKQVIGMYGLQLPFEVTIDEGDRVMYKGIPFSVVYVPAIHEYTGAFIVGLNKVE